MFFFTIAIVIVITIAGGLLKLCRRLFVAPRSFVFKGKQPRDNTFTQAGSKKPSVLLPGKPIPSKSLFSLLLPMLNSQGMQKAVIDAHRELGTMHMSAGVTGCPVMAVADVDSARKIMISSVDHFPKSKLFALSKTDALLGNENVVFVNGSEWKHQRQTLNSAFYNLERYMPIFYRTTLEAFEQIDKERTSRSDNSIVQHELLMKFTLDVLGRAIFHHEFGCLQGKSSKELDAYLYAFNNMVNALDIFLPFWHRLPTPGNRKFNESSAILHEMLHDLILRAKHKMQHDNDDDNKDLNILDLMVRTGLSDNQLRDNSVILFLAGHETSANALSFALAHLAVHQHVQTKLYEAILEHVGEDESAVLDAEKLNSCLYLEWTIKEVLRMNGPVTTLSMRDVTQDEEINGVFAPKGTTVSVSMAAIHHSDAYWTEPEKFQPERFSPEESRGRPYLAWMPFGSGKRICLGMRFAMLEMKCFLTMLLLRYRIDTVPGFEKIIPNPDLGGGMQSIKPGFRVSLVPRKK